MADEYLIPRPNSSLAQGGQPPTREWYNFLNGLYQLYQNSSSDVQGQITELCYKLGSPDGTIANIPTIGGINKVTGVNSVFSSGIDYVDISLVNDALEVDPVYYYGTNSSGVKGWNLVYDAFANTDNISKTNTDGIVSFDLTDLADTGTGTLLATTFDAKGRKTGTRAATITGTDGRVTVAHGDASDGLPTIDLATVPDAGGGTLLRFVRDAWGRITGTSAATTDDLAEGSTNLYFTDAPSDGTTYGRKNGAWSAAGGSGGGILPMVNGETPPVLMYGGSQLIYAQVA